MKPSPLLGLTPILLEPSRWAMAFLPVFLAGLGALGGASLWGVRGAVLGALGLGLVGAFAAVVGYGRVSVTPQEVSWRVGWRQGRLPTEAFGGIVVYYPDLHPLQLVPNLGPLVSGLERNKRGALRHHDLAFGVCIYTEYGVLRVPTGFIGRKRVLAFADEVEQRGLFVRHGAD